jgi:hypothetical protein
VTPRRGHCFRGIRLAAALLTLALPAAAAAGTRVTIDGHITPVIRTVPAHPLPVSLALALHFSGDEDGGLPPILDNAVVHFPFGSQLNGALFPSCDPNSINRRGTRACPHGSQIGAGHAVGVGAGVVEKLAVSLFNGRGGHSVVFFLTGNNPLRVSSAFSAPLVRMRTGTFNYTLSVPVPKNLQRVAGVDLAVRDFVTAVNAKRRVRGRTHGYIEAYACPPGALVPIRGDFHFLEAPSLSVSSYIHCG